MAASIPAPTTPSAHGAIPAALVNVCFLLAVINICYFPAAYFSHSWIWDQAGLGIPTDFVNVWAAGRLVLEGHPAQAYDWDVQRQIELALLRQEFPGYFAWHYPPPFLFVASLAGAVSLRRRLHRLGLGELRALYRHDARDRRPQLRLAAWEPPFRWCSTTRWSGRTAFSPRR